MTHRLTTFLLIGAALVIPAWSQNPAPSDTDASRLVGPIHEVAVRTGLPFSRYGKKRLTLDLYTPKTPGPHPTMLVIPGGAWRVTTKWGVLAEALAEEGIAAAAITHRAAPQHVHPAQIVDCRRAIRFLRYNAKALGLDPHRIGAMGASSGGHLAALLATEGEKARPDSPSPLGKLSTRPCCAVSFSGPMLLVPPKDTPWTAGQARAVAGFLGRERSDNPAKDAEAVRYAKAASPIYRLSPDDPPVMLIHSDGDPVVPVWQSRLMAEEMKRLAMAHDFVEVKGSGHANYLRVATRENGQTPEFWRRTRVFLRKHLLEAKGVGQVTKSGAGRRARLR